MIPFSGSGRGLLVMKESPLVLIHGKRKSAKYSPQPAEGYLVLTSLKGKALLRNLSETNGIFDRVREFKLFWLAGSVKYKE